MQTLKKNPLKLPKPKLFRLGNVYAVGLHWNLFEFPNSHERFVEVKPKRKKKKQ